MADKAITSLKPQDGDSDKMLLERIAAGSARALGASGSDYFADITNHTGGSWCAVMAITDCVFSELVGNITGGLPGLKAGMMVYGAFAEIQLESGSVLAYRN